jgi:hypothetical protein
VNALKAPAALALIAALLGGCGGDGDRAKVEDTIHDALNNLDPAQRTAFPVGAGPPRVKKDSCKSTPKTTGPDQSSAADSRARPAASQGARTAPTSKAPRVLVVRRQIRAHPVPCARRSGRQRQDLLGNAPATASSSTRNSNDLPRRPQATKALVR